MDIVSTAIYKRPSSTSNTSVLVPGWEAEVEAWVKHLRPVHAPAE